jgi:hypothetical protein
MREGKVCDKHQEWCPEGFCRWCEPEQAAPARKPSQGDRFANLKNFRGFGTLCYADGKPIAGIKSVEIKTGTSSVDAATVKTEASADGITWMPLSCDGGYLVPHDIAEQLKKDLTDTILRSYYSYSFEIPINAPRWRSGDVCGESPVGSCSRIFDNMVAVWKRLNDAYRPQPDPPRFYVSPDWLSDRVVRNELDEGDADGDT